MTVGIAFAMALVLGTVFFLSRAVTTSGAVAGGCLTLLYGLSPSVFPFLGFAAFVVMGTLSSRLGRTQKRRLGVYQNEKSPRDWTHALANCGLGAALVTLSFLLPDFLHPIRASLMASGSLCAVCADTCASEWGTWLGGEPRNILTWRPMKVGSDGAVTWRGTLAGIVGAFVIAVITASFFANAFEVASYLVLAGILGNLADSLLGASIQSRLGRHGGSYVNAACGAVGALTMSMLGS